MSLALFADRVENPANRNRLEDAARLLGARPTTSIEGRLIAVENAPGARELFGRRPLRGDATLAVGNERRGLSRTTLAAAEETLVIPTESRTVTTLLIAGEDHVEVGSTLRSAAAFGFRDVLLEDRGAGWFDGPAAVKREARAAARRHKNALRVHRATLAHVARFEEVVVAVPSGGAPPLQRERLTRGRRQLVVVGASPEQLEEVASGRMRVASLGLEPVTSPPLRLVASIVLAEVSRQVGRRRPAPGGPAPRRPTYDAALALAPGDDVLEVALSELLAY